MGGALVIRGEAGVGKTALLEDAMARATDLRSERITGIESEMTLAYAALHELLLPVLSRRVELPPPQRAALEAAFGIADDAPADRFLIGLASLTLLASAA